MCVLDSIYCVCENGKKELTCFSILYLNIIYVWIGMVKTLHRSRVVINDPKCLVSENATTHNTAHVHLFDCVLVQHQAVSSAAHYTERYRSLSV